ncbi:MAG: type II toxin-antitoxin system PemK/MazF family toxin [Candidatus Paceibacterota bacterium]
MIKDFDKWNEKKKSIHWTNQPTIFHEREIWWCALGVNIGFEEDGKNENFERPVLIIKKFNRHVAWIIPLTTQKHNDVFHYQLKTSKTFIILSQQTSISSKRLVRFIEKISEDEILFIFELLKSFYTLKHISTKSDSRPFGAGSPLA